MLKLPTGEWAYIIFFCILYAIVANVQSRMFPVEGSIAWKTRKMVDFEINRLGELYQCEDQALEAHKQGGRLVWIWYEDTQNHDYWCGVLDLETVTMARLRELRPYIKILNSDKSIRRIVKRESNKYISGRGYIQQAAER